MGDSGRYTCISTAEDEEKEEEEERKEVIVAVFERLLGASEHLNLVNSSNIQSDQRSSDSLKLDKIQLVTASSSIISTSSLLLSLSSILVMQTNMLK